MTYLKYVDDKNLNKNLLYADLNSFFCNEGNVKKSKNLTKIVHVEGRSLEEFQ